VNKKRLSFTWKDYFSLLVLPGLFLMGLLVKNMPGITSNLTIHVFVTLGMYLIALVLLVAAQSPVLRQDWVSYKNKLWLKVLISIGGMIAMHAILLVVRKVLPLPVITDDTSEPERVLTPLLLIIGSLPPVFAPFLEEITLRHLLFFKFRNAGWGYPLFFVISSVLFGILHLGNFKGNIVATMPYAIVGAFLALVYAKTQNIWYPIGMHFVFNFTNSLLPAIFIATVGGAIM
jgi:membrane protease YdiL (CAAX protease family)